MKTTEHLESVEMRSVTILLPLMTMNSCSDVVSITLKSQKEQSELKVGRLSKTRKLTLSDPTFVFGWGGGQFFLLKTGKWESKKKFQHDLKIF